MRTIIVAALLSVGVLAYGETVAWWRFADLGEEGGKTTEGMRLLNSVNESLYAATACSFINQEGPGAQEPYMPELTKPFSVYKLLKFVYDPLSKQTYPVSGALSCPWGGDKSGLSGGAVVPISAELCGIRDGVQGDFSFECFFKTTREGLERSSLMEPIVCVPNPDGTFAAWSIIIYNKRLWCRASSYMQDGTCNYFSTANGAGSEITPDVWHHAAVVYSAKDKTFKLYLDYTFVSSLVFPADYTGEIAFKHDGWLYIGKGTYQNDRSFTGEIAEARFSSEALDGSKFLRLRECTNGDRISGDEDTLAWFSMDHLDYGISFFAEKHEKLRDKDDSGMVLSVITPQNANEACVITQGLPGFDNVVRSVLRGTNADKVFRNLGSVGFLTNETAGAYASIADYSGRIGSESFTAELFFKTAHKVATAEDKTKWSYGIIGNGAFKVMINHATGCLYFKVIKADGGTFARELSGSRVDDGNWHHIALVYDKSSGCMSFYLDYSKLAEFNEISFNADLIGDFLNVGISRMEGIVQVFDGWIDEVRLMRRPLSTAEFLAAAPGTSDAMLLRIPFDGDARLLPYGHAGQLSVYVDNTDKLPEMLNKGRSRYITDGSLEIARNSGACRFEGGKISFPRVGEIEKAGITIEFFWRPYEKFAPWPSVLGLSGVAHQSVEMGTDGIWNFFYIGSWELTRLNFLFACVDANNVRSQYSIAASKDYYINQEDHKNETPAWRGAQFDGKWHHVAVTLEEFTNDAGVQCTKATSYYDYVKLSEVTVNAKLYTTGRSGLVMQQSNGSGARLSTWDIDEVRISDSILDVSQFCRKIGVGAGIIIK